MGFKLPLCSVLHLYRLQSYSLKGKPRNTEVGGHVSLLGKAIARPGSVSNRGKSIMTQRAQSIESKDLGL